MVDIIGSIKSAWDLAIHPSKAKPMSIGDALKFYYSFTLIPAIIYAIISATASSMVSPVGTAAGVLQGIFAFVELFIAAPIGFFVCAALYHLFGKLIFRKFQNNYNATFTAVMLSAIPLVLFLWVTPLTLGGVWLIPGILSIWAIGTLRMLIHVIMLINIILCIWGLILLTIALMKLQKVPGITAVLSWLLPTIILSIIAFLIFFATLGTLGIFYPAAIIIT